MNRPPRSSNSPAPPARGKPAPTAPSSNGRVDRSNAASDDRAERSELEAMLKRAAQGDQDAWRVLVETYSNRVFGLIRAQCGSADLAEEITQSAFCTVVAKIDSYSELGKFEQWLFRIAMNRLRDEMRRRKRQARPTEDQTLRAMADAGGGRNDEGGFTAIGSESPEQLAALRIALAELPEADQQIIHLRHSAGLSFKEIAEVLEQPLGTVLARQHRALKKLAETLRPVVEGEPPASRARRRESADGAGREGLQPSGP